MGRRITIVFEEGDEEKQFTVSIEGWDKRWPLRILNPDEVELLPSLDFWAGQMYCVVLRYLRDAGIFSHTTKKPSPEDN